MINFDFDGEITRIDGCIYSVEDAYAFLDAQTGVRVKIYHCSEDLNGRTIREAYSGAVGDGRSFSITWTYDDE